MVISGLPNDERFAALINEAFSVWSPEAQVHLGSLSPGHSGSSVFKADIKNTQGSIRSGIYILKLTPKPVWADQQPEFDAHTRARARQPDFANEHIPSLIAHYPEHNSQVSDLGYAMLFEIAGGSLDRFSPADNKEDSNFLDCTGAILATLLHAWADKEPSDEVMPGDLLTDLCGYRLDELQAPALHELVRSRCHGTIYVEGGEILLNPLSLVALLAEHDKTKVGVLKGLLHGDLHGGNILLHRLRARDNPFFVIDFALCREGAVGYDAAYLELSHILGAVGDEDPARLIGALRRAEDPTVPLPKQSLWAVTLISRMRETLQEWREKEHPYRADQIDRQLALCRVAAGLNWANKPLEPSWRLAALCYASWAARAYVQVHVPQLWESLVSNPSKPLAKSRGDDELWSELWHATNGFDPSNAKFILVAERQKAVALRALGQLPWSAVIDLDPASDRDGLHREAEPLLAHRRAIHLFTSTSPVLDVRRGTGWMMAAGWATKSEFFENFHEWRWQRLPVIRQFIGSVFHAISPEPIHVIVLPGATLDSTNPGGRIGSIVGVIDEATRGRAIIHLLGDRQIAETATQLSRVPLNPADFVQRVERIFGTAFSSRVAEIPGPDGQARVLSVEVLRAMQENLHVLHSSILDEQIDAQSELSSEFWRGRPPTWAELQAGVDIEREINPRLITLLEEKLAAHRNQTVVLEHTPGAGGTTAALRAAWDLHKQYPVAVLHRYSSALAERVRELFQVAERPVLLVADASELTETAREDLHRYFAANNCRVVLLYLRRSFALPDGGSAMSIASMYKTEARSFLPAYSSLTPDGRRRKELTKIAHQKDLDRYRVPFFFGLVTFEREFLGIDKFVASHLEGVRVAVRTVLEHLALVTIFSNGGISVALLKTLLGVDAKSELLIEDLIGAGPASLLIARGSNVRFMHQMIAEKVLAHFQGGRSDEWRLDLKTYSISLVRDAVEAAGAEAMRTLFRQMFVDRMGAFDGAEDREEFAPIIESLDALDPALGHSVLEFLCRECPEESHFWSHLGRHQIYRLKRDYDKAGEYLQRAIALDQSDPVHHHTYGLVLRSQLRHQLAALSREADIISVFNGLHPLFDRAAAEFEESRRLSPDNVYGYITHIQMIIGAARRLKIAVAEDSIARVGIDNPDIDNWLGENIPFAEQLLREATHLYGTLDTSNEYLLGCEADLDQLYGDLDSVVEIWEVATDSGHIGSRGRRALANAYFARNDRSWSGLGVPELRRIVTLMEENLRSADRRDDDYHLWFNAYIMLPEFDANEALSKIALWAKRFPSWRAHYYSYVLNFMLWFSRRTEDVRPYEEALEECGRRHVGRRNASSLWYGGDQTSAGLIPQDDLGGWSSDISFFRSPESLRPVNGIIERVSGPQAGNILIGGRVRAFFVPGKAYSAHRSENERVHFYLGFSPTGLRAWSVLNGHIDGGDRAIAHAADPGSVTVEVPDRAVKPTAKTARAKALRRERVLRFGVELARAKHRIGTELRIEELEARVDALMGAQGAAALAGIADLAAEIAAVGKFEVRGVGEDRVIALSNSEESAQTRRDTPSRNYGYIDTYFAKKSYGFIKDMNGESYWFHLTLVLPPSRRACKREGALVSFTIANTEKGRNARGVSVLENAVLTRTGILPDEQLEAAVVDFLYGAITHAPPEGVALDQLGLELEGSFLCDQPLLKRLGVMTMRQLVSGTEGLAVKGSGSSTRAVLSHEPVLGRLPSSTDRTAKVKDELKRQKAMERESASEEASMMSALAEAMLRVESGSELIHPDLVEALRMDIICFVRDRKENGKPTNIADVGEYLNNAYPGKRRAYKRAGYSRIRLLLESIEGLEIGDPPLQELRLPEIIDGRFI